MRTPTVLRFHWRLPPASKARGRASDAGSTNVYGPGSAFFSTLNVLRDEKRAYLRPTRSSADDPPPWTIQVAATRATSGRRHAYASIVARSRHNSDSGFFRLPSPFISNSRRTASFESTRATNA